MVRSLFAFVWTSSVATFTLVMKMIRLGSHTGIAPRCGPALLFAILGAMLGLVTLSPVDTRSIRLAYNVCTAYAFMWGMLFFMIGLATAASCETAHELKCANWAFWWFAIAVIDWALASWLIWKRMREPSTGQQRNIRLIGMMWRALRIGLPAGATCVITSLVSNALYDPYLNGWRFGRSFILEAEEKDTLSACSDFWLVLIVMVLWWMLSLAATPRRRRRVQAWLLKLVSDQEHRDAAFVAAMVGRSGSTGSEAELRLAVNAMVEQAKQNFYAIPTSSLHLVDLASNEDTGLNERVCHAELGDVDAFVSHSWHDSGEPKFTALMDWAKGFERQQGRTPTVWLDKACIQQAAIEESLRMLPIFLSGCRTLLILAGRTYTSRLWCVLECFVFLKMGGDPERIQLYPFSEESDKTVRREAESAVVVHRLENFDAGGAKCFKEHERQHLLSVIRAGFGSLDEFNSTMRGLLIGKLQPHLAELQREALWARLRTSLHRAGSTSGKLPHKATVTIAEAEAVAEAEEAQAQAQVTTPTEEVAATEAAALGVAAPKRPKRRKRRTPAGPVDPPQRSSARRAGTITDPPQLSDGHAGASAEESDSSTSHIAGDIDSVIFQGSIDSSTSHPGPDSTGVTCSHV